MKPIYRFAVQAWITSIAVFIGAAGSARLFSILIDAHDTLKFCAAIVVASFVPIAIAYVCIDLWGAWLKLHPKEPAK